MGAGKTTVGQVLAQKLGYQFFDLDQIIESHTGRLVREIFAQDGEDQFRKMERTALESCLRFSNSVIALGGGAFSSEENRTLARRIGITVWLDCRLDVCLRRLQDDRSRPLLRGEDEMARLLMRRQPFYEQADLTVRSEADPDSVALAIRQLLDALPR
jgi:shikimate kinase